MIKTNSIIDNIKTINNKIIISTLIYKIIG